MLKIQYYYIEEVSLQNFKSLKNLTTTKVFEMILTWNPGAMLWLEGPGRGQYLQCLLVYIPLMPKTIIIYLSQ